MKWFVLGLLLAGAGASPLWMAAADGTSAIGTPVPRITNLFPDKVVARAKGFEIKQSQVDAAFTAYKASLTSRGQILPNSQRSAIESNLVERLMVVRLLMSKATDEEKARAKERATSMYNRYRSGGLADDVFDRQLLAMGLSNQQLQDRITEQTTCEEVIDREIKSKIHVTSEQAQRFYEENGSKFEEADSVKAAHILFSTRNDATNQEMTPDEKKAKRQLAEKVLGRAKAGEDFSVLVKQFSDDLGSKERNGEYTFSRGRMVPEFEAAAFSMSTNQISDLVATSFGYHIIKLLEKKPSRKVPFAEVEQRIMEEIRFRETQKQLPAFLDQLKKDAGMEWLIPFN